MEGRTRRAEGGAEVSTGVIEGTVNQVVEIVWPMEQG